MGVFSNKIDHEQLKPGDHIYSWRQAYIYAHHGIYVGDGMVIHFTRGGGQEIGTGTVLDRFLCSSSASNATGTPCPKCGDQNKTDAKARGGTCTLAVSDPNEDVLRRASFLLENGFGGYNVFNNNCEDFAIYCKTGLLIFTSISVGRSGQAASCLAAASAVVSTPLRFMTTSFSGLAAVGYGMYCVSRLVSDIGVRRDVSKVPVERLIASPDIDEPEKLETLVASLGIDEPEKEAMTNKED
ncbi:hypothetical protein P8452_43961 [Trifolium repens]|nr:hypothetical protein P8452_43961 [Trifolium repens]